jgi:flagellar hook protein FlgE
VLGFGVDGNFNIVQGNLTPLTIPIGSLSIAEATQNVTLSGNLNADGPLPSQGSRIDITGTATAGLRAVAGAATPPNLVQASNLLVDIEDPLQPGSGTPLFSVGQQLRLSGAEKGTRTIPDSFLTIDPTTTVQDYMDFLRDSLGIQTGLGANPDGRVPGVSLNATTGRIIIDGNTGVDNNIDLATENLNLLSSTGTFIRQPFVLDQVQEADGESVQSAFTMFDSLGAEVTADIRMVLEGKSTTGTTWRYYIDSVDDSDPSLQVATGTLDFDANGRLINPGLINMQIDRANTGAVTPMTVSLNFNSPSGAVTAYADPSAISSLQATFVDGFPFGTLAGFGIARDGTIVGGFDNGLTRTLGQVMLADFSNPEGLVDVGGNLFAQGPNSGTPVTLVAGNSGTGEITSGALELSNVDIGREFIDMILTSTGYTASSRVIRTADELFQQLLLLGS